MKLFFYPVIFLLFVSCGQTDNSTPQESSSASTISDSNDNQIVELQSPEDFIPKGYVLFDQVFGDLNKDGVDDCVLLIKGTDKSQIVVDEIRGKVDVNRRGIVVLFNKNGQYELALKNETCFSSENEDGGVYFAPELSIEIKKGNLYINYGHGRYGYWNYNFRYQNSDFELIGYFESDHTMLVVNFEKSINFSTKKKQVKVNTNENAEQGEEIFEETWSNIVVEKPIKLSEIKDFDVLEMSKY